MPQQCGIRPVFLLLDPRGCAIVGSMSGGNDANHAETLAVSMPRPSERVLKTPRSTNVPPPLPSETATASETAPRESVIRVRQTRSRPDHVAALHARARTIINSLVTAQPSEAPALIRDLSGFGRAVLPALARRFPGVSWRPATDSNTTLSTTEPNSAVAAAMASFGSNAAPWLRGLLQSADAKTQLHAAALAAICPDASLSEQLAELSVRRDVVISNVAQRALLAQRAHDGLQSACNALADIVCNTKNRGVRVRAIDMLAQLRSEKSVPHLVAMLDERDESVASRAHRALCITTGRDFGHNANTWNAWHETHHAAGRMVWLVAGLADLRLDVAKLANDELLALVGDAALAAEEHSRDAYLNAHARYEAWLSSVHSRTSTAS